MNTRITNYSICDAADTIDIDMASDPHLDTFLDTLVDFEDRGIRPCRNYGMYQNLSHDNHAL